MSNPLNDALNAVSVMGQDNSLFPRASAFIRGLPRQGIIDWLENYPIGRLAMRRLEDTLKEGRRA